MADSTNRLTLALRARGATLTAAQMAAVQGAVGDLGDEANKTGRKFRNAVSPVNAMARTLKIVQTRFLLNVTGVVALTIALAAFSPGLAVITGGLIALGAAMGPIIALFGIAALVFKNQFEIAGTAANQLMTTFMDIRAAFEQAFGPAANIILRGVTSALQIMAPLIQQMSGPMEILARALSEGMVQFAKAIVAAGPQISNFILGIVPLIPKLVDLMIVLMNTFLDIAIRGLPAAMLILDWLIALAFWLQNAVVNIDNFLHSAEGHEALDHLVRIVEGLWWSLKLLGEGLFLIVTNFDGLFTVLGAVIPWVVALKVAMWLAEPAALAYAGAQWAANTALLAFPGTWIVLALVALGVAVIEAYQHWEWFRTTVQSVWDVMQQIPTIVWSTITDGLNATLNYIIAQVNSLIDKFNSLPLGGSLEIGTLGFVGGGAAPGAGGFNPTANLGVARGSGTGGAAVVPAGGPVPLSGGFPLTEQPQVVIPITTQLDGKVLAKSIHRSGVKKKSTK